MNTIDRAAALRELRTLVGTYLEGSDDAVRASELIAMFETAPASQARPAECHDHWHCDPTAAAHRCDRDRAVSCPTCDKVPVDAAKQDRERSMFGCTAAAIDETLKGMSPRDVARYAIGTLSNAQELIHRRPWDEVEWSVADRDANTIRQFINIAKYAIDKAVPR